MGYGALATLGMAAAQQGINYAFQSAGQTRGYKKQRKLNEQGEDINKRLTDYNMSKQLEMWEKTGPQGQMEQLKKAGLNPGLIYGMGGAGGQTANVATGGGASGGSVPAEGRSTFDIASMALMGAQKENIEANTHKTRVEAEKIAGVDTEEAHTRVEGNRLNNIFNAKSLEDRVDTIYAEMQKSFSELSEQNVKTNVAENTRAAQISKIKQEALLTTAQVLLAGKQASNVDKDTLLKQSQIIKNDAEIQKMAADIEQKWVSLSQEQKKIELEGFGKKMDAALRGAKGPLGIEVPILDKEKWVQEVDKILSK